MKAKNTVSKKDKSSNPPPNENTSSIESRKRTLSKDELIDFLERSYEESADSIGRVIHKTIPVLMFVKEAIEQEESMAALVLHMKDRDIEYCHAGDGVAEIFEWLSVELAEGWNKIDVSELKVSGEIRRYRADRPKATNSR